MQKIAFRLNSDKAVEYANAHKEMPNNYDEYWSELYFHLPVTKLSGGGFSHLSIRPEPDYTDVTENFERDYWGPWKDKLASVPNDSSPVASHSSAKGNSDELKLSEEDIQDIYIVTQWLKEQPEYKGIPVTYKGSIFHHVAPVQYITLIVRYLRQHNLPINLKK